MDWARRVLDGQANGAGAFVLDGEMVDATVISDARLTIELAGTDTTLAHGWWHRWKRMRKLAEHAGKPKCARFVLDATKELLAQAGYGGMSIRQLESRAGVLPGSLYQHVADKQDLLFCVLLDFLLSPQRTAL